jgi:hypothetical protein
MCLAAAHFQDLGLIGPKKVIGCLLEYFGVHARTENLDRYVRSALTDLVDPRNIKW